MTVSMKGKFINHSNYK